MVLVSLTVDEEISPYYWTPHVIQFMVSGGGEMIKHIDNLIDNLKRMSHEQLQIILDAITELIKVPENTGFVESCPHCGGAIVKNGKQCGRQRYACKSCGKTFTFTFNTVMYRSRADRYTWEEVIADTINFVSLDETAIRLGLSHDRVFHMRHKILAALLDMEAKNPTALSDVCECDETFVLESMKGTELPEDYWREPRKHGATAEKRGISNEYFAICTGIGREGGALAVTVNRAKPDAQELKLVFNGYLGINSLVLCDGHKAYGSLADKFGCSVVDVNAGTDSFYHLNNVNGFHSFIKQVYVHYRGVATKYLNRYNVLFARMYRAGQSCVNDVCGLLCAENRTSRYFSKKTLKSEFILAI